MSFERKSLEPGGSAWLTAQHHGCHSPKGRNHLQDLQDQGSETQAWEVGVCSHTGWAVLPVLITGLALCLSQH